MPDETRVEQIANELSEALFRKYGGSVTEPQLKAELERFFETVRDVVPAEQAEDFIVRIKAIWFDVSPDRN